ncbi:MAG TPA: SDR family oxidoreductase [Bacteroidia bacterium]|nr:SDR family oxidoreductase [Bacteroidia bacterium]
MTQGGSVTKGLDGKTAVITGGNSGIGLATAQRFVQEGAYVFITGRRQNELDKAVKQIGRNVVGVQSDVSNVADLDRLYDTVKQQKGHIDILFANAGGIEVAPLGSITEARSWTVDLKHRKIRVNAVSPGVIATPMATSMGMGLSEEQVEQFKKNVLGTVPLGRMGNPDEIASAVAFLASDDSSYITGIELFVDGGIAQI